MTQTYKVQVSMNQAHIVESGFVWKQGDFGFNIEIEVLDFDTTGATPQIIFRKSSGAVEATQISVAGNKFTYAIRGTELDTPGPCVCDLKLNDSTTKRVSTASFKYFVIPDTEDGLNNQANSYSDTIEQISQNLENQINDIEDDLNGFVDGKIEHDNIIVIKQTAVNKSNGQVVSITGYDTWASSPLYRIPIGTYKIQSNFNQAYGASGAYGYAIYDSDGSFVTGGQLGLDEVEILNNYAYIRMTNYDSQGSHSGLYIRFLQNESEQEIKKDVNKSKKELDILITELSETETQNGKYATMSGGAVIIASVTNCSCKKYDVSSFAGYDVRITSERVDNPYTAFAMVSDENGTYKAGLSNSDITIINNEVLTIPSGSKYLYVNYKSETVPLVLFNKMAELSEVKTIESNINTINSNISALELKDKNLNGLRLIAAANSSNTLSQRVFNSIKKLEISVPESVRNHKFVISMFGYFTSYNRFYFRLYDVTDNAADAYAFVSYDTMPNSGVSEIPFNEYYDVREKGRYRFYITIDWGLYSQDPITVGSYAADNPAVYDGSFTDLNAIITNKSPILRGNFNLDSVITLQDGTSLIGDNCVITCTNNAKIIMKNGSTISNIKFIGPWNVERTPGDGQTYTEYGYVPLISYDDLYNGDTDALYGENLDTSNALIYIDPNNSHNTRVEGCRFENFNKLVIFSGGKRHQDKQTAVICNNFFSDCRMAIYVHAEFQRIYGNEYLRCIIGVNVAGANTNSFGEVFKCCDCAYYFPAGNTAHDEITSAEAAHCGLAGIYAKEIGINFGVIVTGSHFPDAPIIGDSVSGLLISGCRLDTWFKYNSGSKNSIICSIIRKGYMYDKTEQFDVPSDTLITLNRGIGNVTDEEVNWTT